MRRTAVLTLAAALGAGVLTTTNAEAEPAGARSVMFVGKNCDGTATVVDAATHQPLRTIDTIPDRAERMTDILTHPDKLAFYLAVQQGIREGHDQYTDDTFSTHDGRLVAVSRPSFADVVGIDLATGQIAGASRWRVTAPTTWRSPPTGPGCWSATPRPTRCTSSIWRRAESCANSSPGTPRTRATTPGTAPGSSSPASAACTRR